MINTTERNLPLSIKMIEEMKEFLCKKYNVFFSDKQIIEIKALFDTDNEIIVRPDSDSSSLTYTLSNGKVHRFNRYDSDFLRAIWDYSAELRILIMELEEFEMEQFIVMKREKLAKEFHDFFKKKNYLSKETGELIDWVLLLSDYYDCFQLKESTSPNKIINQIKSGKMSLLTAKVLLESMCEEIYVNVE